MSQPPTPDQSWKGLPPWLSFVFLVFGPPAALVAFARAVTQNPLLIALIVLGYWVLLFLGRVASKIWQQLEDPFTGHIARWLTTSAQKVTSRYYRQYYRYMVAEHQIFDMKGLSTRSAHDLALEQVFVDLRIHPQPPHRANADPIRLPEALQGTHSIWEYLSNAVLANPHLVVLGAPGSGKTTLLKHLALTLAQPKKYPRRLRSHVFPILLFLRDHAPAIVEQPTFSLANAVEAHMQRKWQQSIPASWIRSYQERGKCLILLDGLDEVADRETRKLVASWVERQLLTYGRNRFVLTSRPYGYRENPLDGVTVLEVQPFTTDQVERFIQNWYLANERKSWGKDDLSVELHAREGTQDLSKRLHQAPALLSLAVNPLLLTMIATVHRYRSSLPGRRVDLYAEICEVFLGKRQEARGIADELSPAQKQQLLQPLACWMMLHDRREVSCEEALAVIGPVLPQVNTQVQAADFLRHIENTSGLLLEKNPGTYGFAHLTFQEYLAAVHIKEEGMEHILLQQVTNTWWHETIRLYCAQADATAVIQACLAGSPPSISAVALAFECDEEKLRVQPQVQAQLNALLEISREDPDPEQRRLIAEVLLTRRLYHMTLLAQGKYIDTSLVTCAEYQLFLDEQRAQHHFRQPDHWTTFSFPVGSGDAPVLGVRQSDAQAFCTWLTVRDREGWHYRLPSPGEWPVKERAGWKALQAEVGYWTEEKQRIEWARGEPPEAIPGGISLLSIGLDLDSIVEYDLSSTANGLAHDLSFLDRGLANARDSELASARAIAQDIITGTDQRLKGVDRDIGDPSAISAYDLTNECASDIIQSIDRILTHNLNADQEVVEAWYPGQEIDRVLAHNFYVNDFISLFAHARNRAYELVSPRALGALSHDFRFRAHDLARARDLAYIIDTQCMLFLLQMRLVGQYPAYEGILLVKERQQ